MPTDRRTILAPLGLRALLAAGVALPLAAGSAAAQEQAAPTAPEASQQAAALPVAPGQGLSTLLGQQVQGADGETLGEIDDIVFSSEVPTSPFALLSVGGVAGIGDRLVAVPLSDIQRTAEGELTYPETEEHLLAEPTFRRPFSPTTGSLEPGVERSQQSQGLGDPNQPMESLPGVFEGDRGRPFGENEAAPAPRPETAEVLRQEIPFQDRDRFIQAARHSVEQWKERFGSAELSPDERSRIEDMLVTAETRVDRLEAASDANWPALRDTTADIFGKIAAYWGSSTPQTAQEQDQGQGMGRDGGS